MDENNIPYASCADGSPKGFFQLNTKDENYNYIFHAGNDPFDLQMRTYVKNGEVWVNWFVGKRTDSVWVFIDDDLQAINLQNFIGKDPLMESNYNNRKQTDTQIYEAGITAHLWKAKLPEGLKPGDYSIRVMAKDSKGKLFNGFKTFYIDEK